jgi:hypothetical protein
VAKPGESLTEICSLPIRSTHDLAVSTVSSAVLTHADEPLRPLQRLGDGVDRQRARVAGHDARLRHGGLDPRQHLLLEGDVLGHGLDGQLHVERPGQRVEGREAQPLLDLRRHRGVRLDDRDLGTGLLEHLGDADAHRPTAHDQRPGAHARAASPRSWRAMITCWICDVPS